MVPHVGHVRVEQAVLPPLLPSQLSRQRLHLGELVCDRRFQLPLVQISNGVYGRFQRREQFDIFWAFALTWSHAKESNTRSTAVLPVPNRYNDGGFTGARAVARDAAAHPHALPLAGRVCGRLSAIPHFSARQAESL